VSGCLVEHFKGGVEGVKKDGRLHGWMKDGGKMEDRWKIQERFNFNFEERQMAETSIFRSRLCTCTKISHQPSTGLGVPGRVPSPDCSGPLSSQCHSTRGRGRGRLTQRTTHSSSLARLCLPLIPRSVTTAHMSRCGNRRSLVSRDIC
jgi:hypothetical protein